MRVLSLAQARTQYAVTRPHEFEVIRQPMYDYQVYAAAGQANLAFFQVPIGGSLGGVVRTKKDTNMEGAGVFPNPKSFLLESIEVWFRPGTNLFTGDVAGNAAAYLNDVQAFDESGYLELFISSKTYLTDGPMNVFPVRSRLAMNAALSDATTAAASQQSRAMFAQAAGQIYTIDPPIYLPSQTNFNITLYWPVAVALPSATNGRVGVRMGGAFYRQSQ